MVFAPFIYLAHAVCLASPDCADNDNGTFSRLGGWLKKGRGGHQIAVQIHNEGGAIKQCHTSKVKVHESDKKRKERQKKTSRDSYLSCNSVPTQFSLCSVQGLTILRHDRPML